MITSILNKLGYVSATKYKANASSPQYPLDFTRREISILEKVRPYTMTSPERVIGLIRSLDYLSHNQISGDLVECGVWRGGSAMVMAYTLLENPQAEKSIYLYDTFEGMPAPGKEDISHKGELAEELLEVREKTKEDKIWAFASLEDVQENLQRTQFPKDRIHYIAGKVEDTIPEHIPEKIALLRLDTDWYESTYHELEHLFPRLVPGGVLIIDDYGHWKGARKAVDEYFEKHKIPILLNRIDYTGRIAIKR